MKKLILALALVGILAAPALAEVQNIRISGSIDSTYLWRDGFDLGNATGSSNDEEQSIFFTQTLLRVDADLTDQVAAAIVFGNERPWFNDANADDTGAAVTADASEVVLFLAYVELRELLYSPLTLIVGRQDWRYGNSFIFDSTGPNTSAPTDSALRNIAGDLTALTALDAVRAILDYNPLTIEAFVAVPSLNDTQSTGLDDNKYLYGLVGNYELGDELSTVIETYLFYQKDKSTNVASNKAETIKVPGIRVSTNLFEGLNVQAEYAHQSGTKVISGTNVKTRNAHAVQFISNYSVPFMEEYDPQLQYVFTKVTGDDAGSGGCCTDDSYAGWDPFYEAQGGGTIYNSIFNLTNVYINSAAVTVTPMEDVMTKLTVTKLWLEKDLNGGTFQLIQPDGTNETVNFNTGERHVGWELDFDASYDYTEDVSFGLSLGWFFPGEFFGTDNSDAAKQALVSVGVAF